MRGFTRVYDAFGNLKSETGPVTITDLVFGYTGRMFDSDTGLQNNLNRWYDAATGRWLSEDPIRFAAGDANLYRYVGNGVTGATDPSGLIDPHPWHMPEALWNACCQSHNDVPEGLAMSMVMEYLMPLERLGRVFGGGDSWVKCFVDKPLTTWKHFRIGWYVPNCSGLTPKSIGWYVGLLQNTWLARRHSISSDVVLIQSQFSVIHFLARPLVALIVLTRGTGARCHGNALATAA